MVLDTFSVFKDFQSHAQDKPIYNSML